MPLLSSQLQLYFGIILLNISIINVLYSYAGHSTAGIFNELLIEDNTESGITFKDFIDFIINITKQAFHDEIVEGI